MSGPSSTEQFISGSSRLQDEGNADDIPTAEIFHVGDNKESSPSILANTALAADAADETKQRMPLKNHPTSDDHPQQSLKRGFVCTWNFVVTWNDICIDIVVDCWA